MPDRVVSKVRVRDYWLESFVNAHEVNSEKVGFDLGKLVEFDKGVFEHSLIVLAKRLSYHAHHQREQLLELSRVLSFSYLDVVRHGLQSSKFYIELLKLESAFKDAPKLAFVLHEVVQNVAE